jgi:hypothetical protein
LRRFNALEPLLLAFSSQRETREWKLSMKVEMKHEGTRPLCQSDGEVVLIALLKKHGLASHQIVISWLDSHIERAWRLVWDMANRLRKPGTRLPFDWRSGSKLLAMGLPATAVFFIVVLTPSLRRGAVLGVTSFPRARRQ